MLEANNNDEIKNHINILKMILTGTALENQGALKKQKKTRSTEGLSSGEEDGGTVSPEGVRAAFTQGEGSQESLTASTTGSQQHLVYENKAYDQEDKMSTTEEGMSSVRSESMLPGPEEEEDDVRGDNHSDDPFFLSLCFYLPIVNM